MTSPDGHVLGKMGHSERTVGTDKNGASLDLIKNIAELMEKRRALYEEASDITIQTDGKTREQICEEIIGKLRDTNEV